MPASSQRSQLGAQREDGSDQVQQRAGEIVFGGLDHLVIHSDVVDGGSRERGVERRDGQGAGGEGFPLRAVSPVGGVHHAALHGAVPLDPGHHDPHQPILGP